MAVAVTALVALGLSGVSPAFAEGAPTPSSTDTTTVAAPVATPSPEPSTTQTPAPPTPSPEPSTPVTTSPTPSPTSTNAPSAPADVVPQATEPAPAASATPTDTSAQPSVATKVKTDTLPAPPKAPKYNLVAWFIPGGPSNLWNPNQTFADNVLTDTASLSLLDTSTKFVCGSSYQIDLYNNSKTTNDLIAGGKLYGPNIPKEDLAYGALGKDVNPYKVITTPNCPKPPTPKVCPTITTGPKATNLDASGWYQSDTRATGKVSFVSGGVNFQTTDTANPGSSQNKATLYRAITPTPLSQFGEPSVTFANGGSGVKPGMQVGIDVDGNGTWDGYLVGEPWAYGSQNWWVNKPGFNVPSGMGYTSFGSWADFVAANPKAKVIELGLSLGSGVVGNWTVTNLTAGCTSYTFDYVTPTTPVSGTPTITVDGPTCKVPYSTINYTIPAGLSVNGFTGTGSIRAEDYPNARGDGSSIYGLWSVPVVVQSGFSYTGPTKLEYTLVNPTSLDCTVPTVQPENVWFNEGCGTSDDSTNVPGILDGKPTIVRDFPNVGDVETLSFYKSNQGTYSVVDTVTKDGVRTSVVTFVPSNGATVAEPGPKDTYTVLTSIDEVKYAAQWSYTFTNVPCATTPPTTPPTPPTTTTITTTTSTHGNPPSKLAFTGVDTTTGVIGGLGFLVLGLLLINPTRRWLFRVIRRITGRHAAAS